MSAGKNVRAPTMSTTPISKTVKSGLAVGKVAELEGTLFFIASDPAIARAGRIVRNRPVSMTKPVVRL